MLVVASVHAGGYQRAVMRWLTRMGTRLWGRPTAFVSVCLGVLEHKAPVDAQLAAILKRFLSKAGWQPDDTKIVAGALPYSKYGFVRRFVMRKIVEKAGGDTDTSRDYEYTDWDDLRAFVLDFAQRHITEPIRRPPAERIPRTPHPGSFAGGGLPASTGAAAPAR